MPEKKRIERFRTFVAIKLPDELKKELAKVQRSLGECTDSLKFIKPDQLHITLAFLGKISREGQDNVVSVSQNACLQVPPFSVYPTQLGAFPRINRPSLVWIGLGGDTGSLTKLSARLSEELSRRGILPIRGSGGFIPHISLAKVGRKERRHQMAPLRDVLENTKVELSDFNIPVREVVVYQSNLYHPGPEYVPLKRILLQE